jgi:cytochrome c
MNRIIIVLFVMVALFACNNNDTKKEADVTENADYQKGVELVGNSGCMTCHRIDEKITGPTYREVANKYAGASDEVIASLAKKIINGGSGVWGEAVMTPHPAISEEDAKIIVRYILSLKN